MKKKAVLLATVAMLLLSMSGVVMAGPPPWAPEPPPPLVYVNPWLTGGIEGEPMKPCTIFSVSIKVKGVEDLFLANFEMTFDHSVLEVVDDLATPDIEGIDVDDENPIHLEVVYTELLWLEVTPWRTWCKIKVAAGRPLGVKEGLSGTVGLAKITFHVIGYAAVGTVESILKLYFTDLIDVSGTHLYHNVADGMFANVFPTLEIRKVWPKWRVRMWYDCLTNTLYARIANTGNLGATARVTFIIMRSDGFTDELLSAPNYVAAGGTATFSASYHVPAPGRYAFTCTVEYEIMPFRWIPWEEVESVFGGEGMSKDVGNTFKAK